MNLTCPKCQGQMRTYERNGVHVDQCGECRGIFLDRGELEQLVDAENRWAAESAPPPPPQPRYEEPRYQERPRYEEPRYEQKPYYKKKKRSFLEDLFD